jgi:excisionase family DNA binding protein
VGLGLSTFFTVWPKPFLYLGRSVKRGFLLVNDLLTVNEAADILRADATTVRRWVKNGVLEAVVLPHANKCQAYRIKCETVEKLLNNMLPAVPAE